MFFDLYIYVGIKEANLSSKAVFTILTQTVFLTFWETHIVIQFYQIFTT